MGKAIVTVAGAIANPAGTPTAVTPATGDTFTVRNFTQTSRAWLTGVVRKGATAGIVRVRSPLLLDNTQGIRFAEGSGESVDLLPMLPLQQLQAQDALVVEVTGGGAESDGAALTMYYEDAPGANARLASWGDIAGNIAGAFPYEVNAVGGAIGVWADTAITNLYNLLKANEDYAILGYVCDAAVLAVAVKGDDTSNFRIGGPGSTDAIETRTFFKRMSDDMGRPAIPIINAANVGNTFVSAIDVAAATPVNVTLVLAQLATPFPG